MKFRGRERRTESLTVRMLPSVKELLKKSAEAEGLSISEFLELMILDNCEADEENEGQIVLKPTRK
jgi:uncharacterized protein (DUF1778 family)